MESLFIKLV